MNLQQTSQQRPLLSSLLTQHPTPHLQKNQASSLRSHPDHFHSHSEAYNHKRMKMLMQQIRFKQKMEVINRKIGKYKRSTNNCHKKYIGILKNLLFLKLRSEKKDYILSQYNTYRNSRVYYFINLCFLKWHLDVMDIRWIFSHFCQDVLDKISRYRLQINTTNNNNFIHFRKDEIIEMQYSIQSINYFLRGNIEQSIRVLYQKNKYIIIKRNQYLRTLEIIYQLDRMLQEECKSVDIGEKLKRLELDQLYQWNRNINFDDLQSIERLSRRRERDNQGNKDSEEDEDEDEDEEVEEALNGENHENQVNQSKHFQHFVKQEEKQRVQEHNYPLIGLQSSYNVMSQLNWHSWIIQKQKIFEFQMKKRQQQLKKNAQRLNSTFHFSSFPSHPDFFDYK